MDYEVDCERSLAVVWRLRKTVYAPDTKFSLRAIVLEGLSASNVENISPNLTQCAQKTAVVANIQAAEHDPFVIAGAAEFSIGLVRCAWRIFFGELGRTFAVSAGQAVQRKPTVEEVLSLPAQRMLDS